MKTLGLSGVSDTSKILWYLKYHGFENIVFKNTIKHLYHKGIKYYSITKNNGID
jgi:hypothetical protein